MEFSSICTSDRDAAIYVVYDRDAANADLRADRASSAPKLEVSGVRVQKAVSGSDALTV